MSLTDYDDEEENEENEKPAKGSRTVTMDADEFASAIASKLAPRQAETKTSRDELNDMMAYLRSKGVEEELLETQALALRAQEAKLKRELDERLSARDAESQRRALESEAKAVIKAELKSLYREDPELKDFDSGIRAEIDAALKEDTKFWAKFNRGEVDEDKLSAIIEKIGDKYSKKVSGKTGSEKVKNPAMTTPTGGSHARNQNTGKQSEVVNEDELEDHQLSAYYTFLSTNIRRMGMDEEAAKKDAFATAKKLPNIRPKKSVLD